MASKKQIAANRRNAKKSTGPKTPAGKARSARNATKHGLLSSCPVLAEEDPAQYEELRRNLHEDLAPECQLETLLVNRIASAQWRLARVPALEAELLDRLRHDPLALDDSLGAAWERDTGAYGGALGRLARYETMLERGTSRLLGELRRLQAARRQLEGTDSRRGEVSRRDAEALRTGNIHIYDDPAAAWLEARPEAGGAARRDLTPSVPLSTVPLARPASSGSREEEVGPGEASASPSPLEWGSSAPAGRGEVALPRDAAEATPPNEPSFLTTPLRARYDATEGP